MATINGDANGGKLTRAIADDILAGLDGDDHLFGDDTLMCGVGNAHLSEREVAGPDPVSPFNLFRPF